MKLKSRITALTAACLLALGLAAATGATPALAQGTLDQSGTVHSNTTGGNANVTTVNGGQTWLFSTGIPPYPNPGPIDQTGTVHSDTTGGNANVVSQDGGYLWKYSGGAGASMSAPSGFTTKVFEDQFSGTTLNSSNWVTYLGDQGSRWNDNGYLPSPYSGPNMPGDGFHKEMYSPGQLTVDNGVSLTANQNKNPSYDGTYPWVSGIITTEGKFTLPTGSSWYVQVKAQAPDVSTGMWPAIWFLCGISCSDENEFDGYEGGFTGAGGNINDVIHSDFFADQGQKDALVNTGTDLSAGWNTYGVKFVPHNSITVYVNGVQVYQVLASQGYTINAEPYDIMLQLQVAASGASGWHTTESGSTPTSSMNIAEVQAYTP